MRYNPYALAKDGLVNYCGDSNPLDHDGYWYDSSTWKSDDYASCVEVLVLPDGPANARHILVSKLVINRHRDIDKAFQCCGTPKELHGDIRAQIEACKGYMGAEPDESDWREPSVHAFILPDDTSEDPGHFTRYAKIHNATIATEKDVWTLLEKLVGRELNQNPHHTEST